MFESLTQDLQEAFQGLRRRGKLRPEDVDSALREIRLALLEADVHYSVVKDLLEKVRTRALGEEVSKAINPGQQVVMIIDDELTQALGEPGTLRLTGDRPRPVMLVGLQGSGKTTTAAKLGRLLRKQGERVWLIAADVYRPAAVEQLITLGEEQRVPVFTGDISDPVQLSLDGLEEARKAGASVVILDTAGRSQLDREMMSELERINEAISPAETLLVADAMTGQEAVQIAKGFQESLNLTGLVLTKMDGDARGGAAISMRAVTGVPIKYIGTGEGREALEAFDPARLASRILGMGDMLSLIEKAESTFDQEQAEKQVDRLMKGDFTLEDFASQLAQVEKLGPLGRVMDMLPAGIAGAGVQFDEGQAEQQLKRTKAMIQSMTIQERRKPALLNASRKRRIAAGSGTTVQEINQLLRQYKQMQRLFKQMGKRGSVGGIFPGLG